MDALCKSPSTPLQRGLTGIWGGKNECEVSSPPKPQTQTDPPDQSTTPRPLTNARPEIVGTMRPVDASLSHRKRASNVLPNHAFLPPRISGQKSSSAARHASFALVPVPQGERSYSAPGQSTKLRLSHPAWGIANNSDVIHRVHPHRESRRHRARCEWRLIETSAQGSHPARCANWGPDQKTSFHPRRCRPSRGPRREHREPHGAMPIRHDVFPR